MWSMKTWAFFVTYFCQDSYACTLAHPAWTACTHSSLEMLTFIPVIFLCPLSGVAAVYPLRRAPGSPDLPLCCGQGRDDRQAQHGGEGGGGEGRHGQGSLRPPLQLDCQPHQRTAAAWQPTRVRSGAKKCDAVCLAVINAEWGQFLLYGWKIISRSWKLWNLPEESRKS